MYYVISNRESGTGRPDIIMNSQSIRQKAYIFELKVAKNLQEMEMLCKKALKQGVEEKYESELKKEGYSDITLYGICFYRKECMVLKK